MFGVSHVLKENPPKTWVDVAGVFLGLVNDGHCLRRERDETIISSSNVESVIATSVSAANLEKQLGEQPKSLLRSVLLELDADVYEKLAAVVFYPNGSRAQPAIVHRERATAFGAWTTEADPPAV